MKVTLAIFAIAILAVLVFAVACKKSSPEGDAKAAAARGERQFVALLDRSGDWTYPKVPGIPDWYFEHTGIMIRRVTPETKDSEIAYMARYNDALYQALKANGQFHLLEESVARAKANLGDEVGD